MKTNKEWHGHNRMPKNATLAQRIAWHLEHQKNCACRPVPARLLEQIKEKEMKQ